MAIGQTREIHWFQSPIHRERFSDIWGASVSSSSATSFNPLFIGNAFATGHVVIPSASKSTRLVAIPYSSGMLLLHSRRESQGSKRKLNRPGVAIPYSSGMLLLHIPKAEKQAIIAHRRNPLFIGNAFATTCLAHDRAQQFKRQESQSPIHRECFCYRAWEQIEHLVEVGRVAIPYSSGMLLLPVAARPCG